MLRYDYTRSADSFRSENGIFEVIIRYSGTSLSKVFIFENSGSKPIMTLSPSHLKLLEEVLETVKKEVEKKKGATSGN